jgi:hypothetical protein
MCLSVVLRPRGYGIVSSYPLGEWVYMQFCTISASCITTLWPVCYDTELYVCKFDKFSKCIILYFASRRRLFVSQSNIPLVLGFRHLIGQVNLFTITIVVFVLVFWVFFVVLFLCKSTKNMAACCLLISVHCWSDYARETRLPRGSRPAPRVFIGQSTLLILREIILLVWRGSTCFLF